MKQFSILLSLASFMVSLPSFALVIVKADCFSADRQYEVLIEDNQGIGPVRSSHLGAIVLDSREEVVASYPLVESGGSFKDASTNGKHFWLDLGSTRSEPALKVRLTAGPHRGSVLFDGKMDCS